MQTTGRVDIFLEGLAWYASQPKVRWILFFHPFTVIRDMWRQAGKSAEMRKAGNRRMAAVMSALNAKDYRRAAANFSKMVKALPAIEPWKD